jgi:hypothetical protein
MTESSSPMPSPPYPSTDNAIKSVRAGETSVEDAMLHAVVHAWYKGHIEGEDTCPGCDFRGQLPKNTKRG